MWAGAYSLDLYCDNVSEKTEVNEKGELVDEHGHLYNEFPHQYVGEQGSHIRNIARKAGWTIGDRGQAVCPKCNAKKRKR